MQNPLVAGLRFALFLTVLGSGAVLSADGVPAGPTVAADMIVEDKTGKPVVDLKRSEVAIFQGEERQELTATSACSPRRRSGRRPT